MKNLFLAIITILTITFVSCTHSVEQPEATNSDASSEVAKAADAKSDSVVDAKSDVADAKSDSSSDASSDKADSTSDASSDAKTDK